MKMNTYIDTYNQITSKYDVSDCNKFLTVLDSNYEKYKYFHRLIKFVENKFDFNFYEIHNDELTLTIKIIPGNHYDIDTISSIIKENINMTDTRDSLFDVSIETNDDIVVCITCDKPEKKIVPHIYKNMTVI